MNIIYPSNGKLFANSDETELYSALILASNDSIENYHQVDELAESILNEKNDFTIESNNEEILDDSIIELHPDENGKISYEEANQLLLRLSMLTKRVIALSEIIEKNNI